MIKEKMHDYLDCIAFNRGGFNFDNYLRNEMLISSKKMRLPPMTKTGTTICGVVCKDAVILGADTRETGGNIVADKKCCKLHRISNNIFCAGAGVSADLLHTTYWLESSVELHRLSTGTLPRVNHVVNLVSQELFKYMGYKQCALVLGGVDILGPHLYKIYPHGSTDKSAFASMGSGSLFALAVLEAGFKENMTIDEGKNIVINAIKTGIYNDLGSGGNVDICIITKEGCKFELCSYASQGPSKTTPKATFFPKGTTPFTREKIKNKISVNDTADNDEDKVVEMQED